MHHVHDVDVFLLEHPTDTRTLVPVVDPRPRRIGSPHCDGPYSGAFDDIATLVARGVVRGGKDNTLVTDAAELGDEVESQPFDPGVVRRKELMGDHSDTHCVTPA
jgi:hypothetical protein